MLLPRQSVPELAVSTLTNGEFNVRNETVERGIVICFYRGLHCPICAKYLMDLGKHVDGFEENGYSVVAISSDQQDRAQEMADKVKADNLRFGYALSLSSAKEWGLYISTSRGKTSIGIEEPALFSEPGLFVVNKDQSLYYGSVQTMPFVRPHFSELAGALEFAVANDYPARGEYAGTV